MRVVKAILILCSAILAASCAPNVPSVPAFVPKAKVIERPDAAPAIAKARQDTAKADNASAVTKIHLESSERTAALLREALGKSVNDADRLRKQGSASQQDLTSLWIDLTNTLEKNRTLSNDLSLTSASFLAERELRNTATSAMDRAEAIARSKDREAAELRLHLTDSEANRQAIHTTSQQLSKTAAAAAARADNLAGAIRVHWIGHVIATVIIICLGALIVFRPRFL